VFAIMAAHNIPPTAGRTIAYTRVSTDEQAIGGQSLAAKEHQLYGWQCKLRTAKAWTCSSDRSGSKAAGEVRAGEQVNRLAVSMPSHTTDAIAYEHAALLRQTAVKDDRLSANGPAQGP
jgi:hypothetical protein